MKSLKFFILLIFINLAVSCVEENQAPSCSIISPADGAFLVCGQIITISVEIEDENIEVVKFLIDNVEVFSTENFPYTFNWDTKNVKSGSHIINVFVIDQKGLMAEVYLNIILEVEGTFTFTDERDNKTYKAIKIGNQTWMAENLAYLPQVNPPSEGSATEKCYYVYDFYGNIATHLKPVYGVLYNWPAAMDGKMSSNSIPSGIQGVCPKGWHLPSYDEWGILTDYLIINGYGFKGSGDDIAKSISSKSGWELFTLQSGVPGNDPESNNISGFSAFPGGMCDSNGTFSNLGKAGMWWSSTKFQDLFYSYNLSLTYNRGTFDWGGNNRAYGFSVRCVKD